MSTGPALRVEGSEPQWWVLTGDVQTAQAQLERRPDQRAFLDLTGEAAQLRALLTVITAQVGEDLYCVTSEADTGARTALEDCGFAIHRVEDEVTLSTQARATSTQTPTSSTFAPPAGVQLISAREADPAELCALDELLRQDVPGTAGWVNDDIAGFAESTYDPEHFDPATYVVAIEEASGRYVGLARVWHDTVPPRLGMVAVSRRQRSQGLASALLEAAFAPLRARGVREVVAEVDTNNGPSKALLARWGAVRTGSTIEYLHPRR